MVKEKRGGLNVDIPTAINELQSVLKHFKLKEEIFRILFRGKGLEFEGYRDFNPDDDASDIDWKTSSRTQKLLVKQYKEERDLKIMFLIDVGDNMVFGSTPKLKCEYITELVSALGYVIITSNDQIGFFLFSDVISNFVEAKGGQKHLSYFIDNLINGKNYGGKTDLDQALTFAMDYFNKSISSVIVVSDFLNLTTETEKKLTLLSSMFETVLLRVRDPLDISLPNIEGEIILEDPGTHQQMIVNPKIAGRDYNLYALQYDKLVKDIFKKTSADFLDLTTNQTFAVPLAMFLKERRFLKE